MIEKKRVDYLDIFKGFAILLILVHHVFQYFPALSGVVGYVTDFHVPCFFLASGWVRYITMDKPTVSYKEFAIKKVRRLLVPYLVFAVFSSVLKIGVLAITHSFTFDVMREEAYQILTIGNGPVWFLYRLFMIELIVELVFRFGLNKEQYLVGGISVIVGVILVVLLQGSENYFIMEFRSLICGSLELVMGYYCSVIFYKRDKIQDHSLIIGGGGVA